MVQDRLWAPWRLSYVKGEAGKDAPGRKLDLPPGGDPDCFLCRGVADDDDRRNLIVARGGPAVAVLNRFPYNNGHVLIACSRHCGRIDELSSEENLACLTMISQLVPALERVLKPNGFNVGLNLGRVAGAGLPGHLHWHVVPRWDGDTNFMPVLAGTKVIPQSLDALWELLQDAMSQS